MNYYSIEFFKFYLNRLHRQFHKNDARGQEKTIQNMMAYVKDREKNNESAYKKSWMKKPKFI